MPEIALSGSMGKDIYKRYRNPIELGWGKTINFDHDFIGKEALQRIAADPNHRVMVTLEWNVDDIMDIHRSQYTAEPYKDISDADDLSFGTPGLEADQVLDADGKLVGIATGRMFSWYYRHMISLCSIDKDHSDLGTEVYVVWGEPGTKQKKIRATVARYPYFNTDRNQKVDVSKIPQGTME
jgi:glycine cleavage system aminomethyltransferase T